MKPSHHLSLAAVLFAGAAFAACGTSASTPHAGSTTDGGGNPSLTGDGGVPILGGGGNPDGSTQGVLAISPTAPSVTVTTGQPVPTVQFSATLNGVATTSVGWSIDQGALGTIDSTGKFTPSGTIGGTANVTASNGSATATTTVTVILQMTNLTGDPGYTSPAADAGAGGYGGVGGNGPGAPPNNTQTGTLNGTPTADSSVSILYPYDGTVWPQGLLAPLLQWNPGSHAFDSVYVHISETNFDYKGYFASNTTGAFLNVPIPAAAWNALTYSNDGTSPVTVSLVFGQGANAYGPYTETWKIAQATLQGTIYYNSYGTALVKNSDTVDNYNQQYGAGTLAIAPGATAPTLIAGYNTPGASGNGTGCRVCHTVAPNGQSMVTQASNINASDYSDTVEINLANDTTAGAGTPTTVTNLTFPALYKDGTLAFSSTGGLTYPASASGTTSQLYALPGGTPVSGVTGIPAGLNAALPSFSPDGAHVAFNFWGGSFTSGTTTANADQVSLAMMDFDGKNTFSNPRVVNTPASGTSVTYSSFFPNSAGIVFEVELQNAANAWGYTWNNNTAELWWLDVASGKAHRLDALNGYGTTGAVYLPSYPAASGHSPAIDATLNYEATVNPIASGGYAWVVFTSRRIYGNLTTLSPWTSDPRNYAWLDPGNITDKKLWVAAVDLNGTPGTDPSHPAFYLPAQELHAGNARGYWTVEACRANGAACNAGDQCCGGYCETGSDGGLQCTAQAPSCSQQYDKCTTTADCCSGGSSGALSCINGVCTQSVPK